MNHEYEEHEDAGMGHEGYEDAEGAERGAHIDDLSDIRLGKDLKEAAKLMPNSQIRFLVDRYYQLQQDRIRASQQMDEKETPNQVLAFVSGHAHKLEALIKSAMKTFCENNTVTQWMMTNVGVGPVISAGIYSHLDITKAPTAGHIWSFAGLNPAMEWIGKKGADAVVKEAMGSEKKVTEAHIVAVSKQISFSPETLTRMATNKQGKITRDSLAKAAARRPWNARLKVLSWKLGQSLLKFYKKPECYYGHLYAERKRFEVQNNEAGLYAEQAAQKLERFKIGKDTDAYKWYIKGMLPPAHLNQRALRVAEKLFLSHLHHVMYQVHYGKPPAEPYGINILGHAHYIPPFHWDVDEGRIEPGANTEFAILR